MKVSRGKILADVILIQPRIFDDRRGYFLETYQLARYVENGIKETFVQDNLSFSYKGVLRGLHYQLPRMQAKLVHVLEGEIFDVVVDIRVGSPTFGRWESFSLSGRNKRQLFVPGGFAHGFCVLSNAAYVMYKCTNYYYPEDDGGIIWSDPDLKIKWPIESPILSEKDSKYGKLREIPKTRLPSYI